MKALSIRDPWISLITSGRKRLEIRSWRTDYRGPLLLCASASADRRLVEEIERGFGVTCDPALRGHARCIVELLDCRLMRPEDESLACVPASEGLFAWVLGEPQILDRPFPVKGRLGFFSADHDALPRLQ